MSRIPLDFPNDAPLPSGKPRCAAEFGGKRCKRPLGHEHGWRHNPRHHIAADETRWSVGPNSGETHVVNKCTARFGEYQCDRWPHVGYHGAQVSPDPALAHLRRIEWIGNGASAEERVYEDDGAVVGQQVGGQR